jgi:hypothetical protein
MRRVGRTTLGIPFATSSMQSCSRVLQTARSEVETTALRVEHVIVVRCLANDVENGDDVIGVIPDGSVPGPFSQPLAKRLNGRPPIGASLRGICRFLARNGRVSIGQRFAMRMVLQQLQEGLSTFVHHDGK